MKTKALRAAAILSLLLPMVFPGDPLSAQGAEQYRFNLDFGNRWISDLSGSRDLFRSHLNLGEGIKLFGGEIGFSMPRDRNFFMDRFEYRMHNWGGEPYNTAELRAEKEGVYQFRFDYKNVQYFNAVPSFANPLFAEGNLETQNKFDSSIRTVGFELTLRPGHRISPFVHYFRSTQEGLIRTTVAADGDEFVVGADLDLNSNDLEAGVSLTFDQFSLLLSQAFRWYSDSTEQVASGFQEGNLAGRLLGREITLEEYSGRNDFDGTTPYSNVVAVFRPHRTLLLRGKASYSNADLNNNFAEAIRGNFFALSPTFAFFSAGNTETVGDVQRPSLFLDFSAEWQPHRRFGVIERFSTRRYHVSSSLFRSETLFDVDPLLGPGPLDRLDSTDLLGFFQSVEQDTQEITGLFYVKPGLVLRGGHRYVRKELKLERRDNRLELDQNVLLLGGSYQFSMRNRISADFELGRSDQGLFRLDPVDFHRLRIRGRLSPMESLQFDGSISFFDHDNNVQDIDLSSDSRTYNIQFHYQPSRLVSITGQYERVDYHSDLLFVIPQTFTVDRSFFRERGDFGSLYFSFRLVRDAKVSLGYSVWGNVGSFPQTFHQPTATVEVPIESRVTAYARYNYYGYNEKVALFPQDYRVHMAVFGFRINLTEF